MGSSAGPRRDRPNRRAAAARARAAPAAPSGVAAGGSAGGVRRPRGGGSTAAGGEAVAPRRPPAGRRHTEKLAARPRSCDELRGTLSRHEPAVDSGVAHALQKQRQDRLHVHLAWRRRPFDGRSGIRLGVAHPHRQRQLGARGAEGGGGFGRVRGKRASNWSRDSRRRHVRRFPGRVGWHATSRAAPPRKAAVLIQTDRLVLLLPRVVDGLGRERRTGWRRRSALQPPPPPLLTEQGESKLRCGRLSRHLAPPSPRAALPAAEERHADRVALLLNAVTSPVVRVSRGLTPADCAAARGHHSGDSRVGNGSKPTRAGGPGR
eukprot:scaffold2501_cov113-Isochrysis_galbana.AAC.1